MIFRNNYKLFLALLCAAALSGCSNSATYLGRSDATGMKVIAPLSGVLASVAGDPNVVWSAPDTNKTIDVVFDVSDPQPLKKYSTDVTVQNVQKELAKLVPTGDSPSYRYFKYAEGVPIPAYKVEEGVNIVVDKKFRGQDDKKLEKQVMGGNDKKDDTAAPTNIAPILARVLNPIRSRWSANPEIYTLREDYLNDNANDEKDRKDNINSNNNLLSQYDFKNPEQMLIEVSRAKSPNAVIDPKNLPPAVLLVLYQPATYWQTDDITKRDNSAAPMYFDAYYSIDNWNLFVNKNTGVVGDHPDKLNPPNNFGICKYENPLATSLSITLLQNGTPKGDADILNNSLPTKHQEQCRNNVGHCCSSIDKQTGDCLQETEIYAPQPTVDQDVKFTLIDLLKNSQWAKDASEFEVESQKPSQPDVNLWTKYEFIEMLQGNNLTFQQTNNYQKPLKDKGSDSFSPKSNLRVPEWLFSKDAFNANISSECANDVKCALAHSKYRVSFVNGDKKNVFYHNRALVHENKIYERSDSHDSSGLQWPWCWFTPE